MIIRSKVKDKRLTNNNNDTVLFHFVSSIDKNMFILKFVLLLCLLQTCKGEKTIEEVQDSFSRVIDKLHEEVSNFSINTYKKSAERVNLVLSNNTREIQKLKETLSRIQVHTNQVVSEYGISFYSHLVVECKSAVEKKKELIAKTITEAENICLMFISDVFTLIENPELYKNISDARLFIKEIDIICRNFTKVKLAEDCYKKEIYKTAKPKFKKIEANTQIFLENIDRKVNAMTDSLHTCYSLVQKDVLNIQQQTGVREFRKCVSDKTTIKDK